MTAERKGREQVEGKSALKSIAFQGKSLINELEKVKCEKWIRWLNKILGKVKVEMRQIGGDKNANLKKILLNHF